MSGYDFLKSQVFSRWRKVGSDCDVVISSGRVFQTGGPANENAGSPTVERLTDGTIRRLVPPEHNVRRPGRLAIGTSGPRYRGALPCKTLYFQPPTTTPRLLPTLFAPKTIPGVPWSYPAHRFSLGQDLINKTISTGLETCTFVHKSWTFYIRM